MPIRINLKEVFTADSQDLVINKVNFNFNKLLELGIGEDGPIGLTGPQGPAGPTGLPGDPGTPGNIWYVGTTADPNNDTFPDVNTGDFYLDTELFTIWRYNGTIWLQQTDITQIIEDYLSTAGSVLTRGFGNGTVDNNFIVFNNRGQDATRRLNDSNDILFLNNFSETYLNSIFPAFTLNSSAFFNSLLSISVDRSDSAASYRQHIELGVLYGDGSGTPEGHTSTNESLKIKYERVDSPVLGNDYYNIATLSLDLPETVSVGRTTNGVFNFVSPKMYTGVDTNSNVYIGSRYGLDEVYGTSGTMKADGLLFHKSGDALYANIGIAQDFLIPNYPAATGYVTNLATNGYFMIDSVNNTLTGVYLNDPLYLTGGNLIQLGNTTPRNVYSNTSTITFPFVPTYKRGGITAVGNTLFTIRGESGTGSTTLTPLVDDIGWFNRFNIEDPNTPRLSMNVYADGQTYGTTRLIGANASDIAASGNYVYIVNDQNILNTTINGSNKRTYFQILSPDSVDSNYTRISTLGTDSMFGSSSVVGNDPEELNSAYKVKIKGGYALVATNALHSLGNNSHSRQFLGQYQTSVAGEQYDGYLTSIDITNPAIPKIKSSATNTKETITDWAVNNGVNTYIQRSAILDFDISGDYAYALTWEQTVSDLAATAKIYVKIVAFDISNPNSIAYHGKSDSASTGTFIEGYYTDLQIDQLVTVGAIASNDQYIYAGYENRIKVFRTYDKTGSYIFPVASTYTIPGTTSSQFITDIKQFGNSLYAIVNLSPSSAPYTKIYKFNINDSTLTQVWEKEIVGSSGTSIATHFVVIGKHIYCSVHNLAPNNTGLPVLITIDYDGIYTSGAHIESLRSDIVSIMHDLTVGGHAQLDSSLMVAGPAGIQGELEVGSNARINGELRVSSYGAGASAIEVGADRTASGYAYIDLIGDTTYGDYGVRLIRNATGANATSELIHNGTGNLEIITNHAAAITFKTNSTLRAQIDDAGIKLENGSASLPSYAFINDTDTGLYIISDGTLGFTANGTKSAALSTSGLDIYVDGDLLRLRGTTHSYMSFYGKGNLANPSDVTYRSAYVGFKNPLNDTFDIKNEKLDSYINLDYLGQINLHSETTTGTNIDMKISSTVDISGDGNVLYLYSNVDSVTDVGMGMLRNRDGQRWGSNLLPFPGSGISSGTHITTEITSGGSLTETTASAGFPNVITYVIDDRNLTIKHSEDGYINLLNTPTAPIVATAYDLSDIHAVYDIGLSPTHSGVHTRFASRDGSIEYANINTSGLDIANTLKFTDATYSIKSADDDTAISGNNSGLSAWKMTQTAGHIVDSTAFSNYFYMTTYSDLTVANWIPDDNDGEYGAGSVNAARTYDIQVNALIVTSGTMYVEIAIERSASSWVTMASGQHRSSATALIPAGYRWRLMYYIPSVQSTQINVTLYKLGMQTI